MLSSLVVLAVFSACVSRCAAQTWTYQGCYVDSVSKRTLTHLANTDSSVQTVEVCTNYCSDNGFSWAGLEYGQECWCDRQLPTSAVKTEETGCSMPCRGNSSQICGNGDRLSVYSSGRTTSEPSTNPGSSGWSSLGCYTDSTSSRTLRNGQSISAGSSGMTVAECTAACKTAGYTLAGVEWARECFCDDAIRSPGVKADDGCDMPCAGNSSEFCGGTNRLNVYQTLGSITPGPNDGQSPVVPAGWTALGCLTDQVGSRTLIHPRDVPGGPNNMTIGGCLGVCSGQGYSYGGLEFGQECFCDNGIADTATCASDQSSCSMACKGARSETCGGPDRINVYYAGRDTSVLHCGARTSTTTAPISSSTVSSISTNADTRSTTLVTSTISSSTSSSESTTTLSSSSTTAQTSISTTTISSSSVTVSSSTTATPTSTVCPTFWSAVVADLAPRMRENGQCNNMARAAIRYAFHDAGAYSNKTPFYSPAGGGADGSLLLSSNEINRIDHDGLHEYHGQLQQLFAGYKAAGYAIGAADLIQVACMVALLACPGGRIGRVLVGRGDTDVAAPDGFLPIAFGPGSDHDTIFQLFADKGFSARDLAALLGAHSTSIANFQTAHGIPAGSPQDSTPGLWDINYYNETYFPPAGVARFESDINLSRNVSTPVGRQFQSFVGRQGQWGASFASAIQAMSLLGVPTTQRTRMQDCTSVVAGAFS